MIAALKTFCTIVLLHLCSLVVGQVLPVRYLGIDQGLSNNSVFNIYQDHNGLMWFGTSDGLSRYDGYDFKVFQNVIGDSTSLLSNTIYAIRGDAGHHLWVGGQKGACVYNPASGNFAPLWYQPASGGAPQPLQDIIHNIQALASGKMLVATQSLGLLLFNSHSTLGKPVPLKLAGQSVTNYDVYAIASPPARNFCWVGLREGGLYKYFFANGQLQLVSNRLERIDCMATDRQGRLWVGNGTGLFQYDEAADSFSPNYLPLSVKVTNILHDRAGMMWASTDGEGVFTMAKGQNQFSRYLLADGSSPVKSSSVWSVYEDVQGHKWLGTLRGGISLIDFSPRHFRQVVYQNKAGRQKPEENFILSFAEDEKHNVWIGTDGGGLRYWDRQQNTLTNYIHTPGSAAGLSSNFITSIIIDTLHDTWVATWFGGINRIHQGKMEHFTCKNPLTGNEENNVWRVYEDRQKNLWASTTNPGVLYLFNRQANRFELFDSQIADLQSLTETSDGQLWGGNYTHLIQIDRIGKKHRFYKIGYPVRSILEDRQHRLWLGTQDGGLLLFNRQTGKFAEYTTANGLPNNTVLRMLEDRKGQIWMSTYNGLSCFSPAQQRFRNFSVSDGLQSSQFGYNAALALQSGEFLFGGINGFNIFFPDSITGKPEQPQLLLSGITINNSPVEKDSTYVVKRQAETVKAIRIPYNEATLSLDFLSLNYTSAANTSYVYYLEGWDKEWNNAGTSRKANYSRLHEGTYLFKVKATGSNGEWSQPATLLTITVLPPWYRSWWAYGLYLLAAAGAVYAYLYYTRRQERLRYEIKLAQLENEKEKELSERQLTMFTHISHEFRTPLSLIINPLKKVISQKNKETASLGGELSTAHRNARRLLSLVDQLLLLRKADSGADRLNISHFDAVALCNEVFQCFVQQAKDKHIDFRFEHSVESDDMYGDYEKLEIALFNLLSNAFKFTPSGGSIQLIVSEVAGQVQIEVTDTGCGISPEDQERIFGKFQQASQHQAKSGFGIGLYLVRHFAEKHNGTVSCTSEAGQGTRFVLILPKGEALLTGQVVNDKLAVKSELMEEMLEPEALAAEPTAPEAVAPARAEDVLTEKKSILVIDDNPEIRRYLLQLFTSDYLTYSAENAEMGYQLAEKHNPDLIISDIAMEGAMDGVALCQKIKQSEALNHIPVILLTAATNPEVKLQGISGGADDYITKPFDADLLVARVQNLLKSRNQLRKYFLNSITLKENNQKVPAEYQDFLRRCIETVEANLDKENFDSKAFARAMGMSHSNLYQKIKTISGQTLNAFVRSIRIRRAAVLMLTENLNVNQAGFQVGFEDVRYFREQFVKLFGMTPSEYIKKYRHSFNKDLNIIK